MSTSAALGGALEKRYCPNSIATQPRQPLYVSLHSLLWPCFYPTLYISPLILAILFRQFGGIKACLGCIPGAHHIYFGASCVSSSLRESRAQSRIEPAMPLVSALHPFLMEVGWPMCLRRPIPHKAVAIGEAWRTSYCPRPPGPFGTGTLDPTIVQKYCKAVSQHWSCRGIFRC